MERRQNASYAPPIIYEDEVGDNIGSGISVLSAVRHRGTLPEGKEISSNGGDLWQAMDQLPPGVHDVTFKAGTNLDRHFYMGPPGSGIPMHSHVAAWDALVWGRKYW